MHGYNKNRISEGDNAGNHLVKTSYFEKTASLSSRLCYVRNPRSRAKHIKQNGGRGNSATIINLYLTIDLKRGTRKEKIQFNVTFTPAASSAFKNSPRTSSRSWKQKKTRKH